MDDDHDLNEDELMRLLSESVKFKLDCDRPTINRLKLNASIVSVLEEFMTTFKVIGYDLDGKEVNIIRYHNNMEKSAIENALMEDFSKFMESKLIDDGGAEEE